VGRTFGSDALDKIKIYCLGLKFSSDSSVVQPTAWSPDRMSSTTGADDNGEKAVQITRARKCGRGPGAQLSCMHFAHINSIIICRLNKFTPSDQSQVIRQMRLSCCRFSRSALAGGPNIFTGTPTRSRLPCVPLPISMVKTNLNSK
jgi:hypothetical protein